MREGAERQLGGGAESLHSEHATSRGLLLGPISYSFSPWTRATQRVVDDQVDTTEEKGPRAKALKSQPPN